MEARDLQPDAREGQAGPDRVSERPIVPMKPGNSGGGKGPRFRADVGRNESREIGVSLTPPEKVQKLQMALHAKAKGSPRYRFYALYDKVYREDLLAFAYRCCRANGGAAGVDGQGFKDIEAYGLNRWLGELTEPGIPDGERVCPIPAPAVVMREAQSTGGGDGTIPRRVPGQTAGTRSPGERTAQHPVGEDMKPCPRAGCGKSARPVR